DVAFEPKPPLGHTIGRRKSLDHGVACCMVLGMTSRKILALFYCFPLVTLRLTAQPLLIRDVRLFDGENVTEHRSVVVEDGKLSRIDDATLRFENSEIIDGRGRTLLPGFFDAHVHVPQKPEAALHYL